jgi:hypothetical protein
MNILPVATTPITASESISNRPSRVIGSGMGVVEFFMRLASQKQARLSITEKDQFGGGGITDAIIPPSRLRLLSENNAFRVIGPVSGGASIKILVLTSF